MSLMLSKTSVRTWFSASSLILNTPLTLYNYYSLPKAYQNGCFVDKLLHCHKLKKVK